MESTTERLSVRREVEIAASPDTVWQFLVDPEKCVRWWGTSIRFDGRVGGGYRIDISPGQVVSGELVALEPPRLLVYTFGWEAGSDELMATVPPGSTTVEIELLPVGAGTLVRLLHRDLPDADSATAHGGGWQHYLDRLAVAAPGGDPGPDPWLTGAM